MTPNHAETLLQSFRDSLAGPDHLARLSAAVIGEGRMIDGGFGPKPLIYADYVASGRALRQVEHFILEEVLPLYANSHTEASTCGAFMTRLRRAGRAAIARLCGADASHAVIFCGNGATAGLNRLVALLGVSGAVARGERPLVLIGPYEHHSNILPWRESGAEVIEIGEAETGGPDLGELERVLRTADPERLVVGAFSALSNVTGILTGVAAVTALLKRYGALSVWDYAGGGPYLPIDMGQGMDAVVVSPHKFVGGPGASGVLVLRRDAVRETRPSVPGGGTVRFVSPWGHDYSADVAVREEAGTPNVLGDIRAALAFLVKDAIGQEVMDRRHAALKARALEVWGNCPEIELLGQPQKRHSLPIFSFRIRDMREGGNLHPQLVTRMLADLHGIQARGGCACAGPYAHRLLGLDQDHSEALRQAILSGEEMEKPGWTRLNLSVLMSDKKVETILGAVAELARAPYPSCLAYEADPSTARFRVRAEAA